MRLVSAEESKSGVRRATVRLTDGTTRTFVAFPVRAGWHPAPPCSDSQPVYATPADAALAHARTLNLEAVDAVEISHGPSAAWSRETIHSSTEYTRDARMGPPEMESQNAVVVRAATFTGTSGPPSWTRQEWPA